MDNNAQPPQPRILQNPHLAECPDFGDGTFDEMIETMLGPGRTRDQAIEGLRAAWLAQNNRRKELWDAQVLADQRPRDELEVRAEAMEDHAHVQDDLEIGRRKPKLGAFAEDVTISNKVSLKPSAFAINKLKDMKYIELYCFTPAGCRDHANQRLSTADEAFSFTYGITPDGSANNSLSLKPVSALAHPGKIIPDENLTWEQVRDAKACFLSHVIEAGWDRAHVNALALFFCNLDSHPYIHTPEGKQALVWYQAHARDDWHRKLGTPDSYNIAILNDTLLTSFKKKADDASIQNRVSMVSPFCFYSITLTNHDDLSRTLTASRIMHACRPHMAHALTCTAHHIGTHAGTLHLHSRITSIPSAHAHFMLLAARPCVSPHPPSQLSKQLDEATARLASATSARQPKIPLPRSRTARYQPYNTTLSTGTMNGTRDEDSRSHRSISSSRRSKVGTNPATDDGSFTVSSDSRSLSACAICLGRNPHDVTQCDATTLWDGHTPAFTRRADKGARLRAIHSGDAICLDWNLSRSCQSSSHLSRHRCSGCGGEDHGAQSCRLTQPKVSN
jgi:hypothetical protein